MSSSGTAVDFCTTFSWLCSLPTQISGAASSTGAQVWSYFQTVVNFLGNIESHYSTATPYLQGMKSTFFQGEELKGALQGLVEGFPKLLKYIYDPSKREEVTSFFKGDEYQKTVEGLKWLSGAEGKSQGVFEVEKGLLAHLMRRVLSDPDKSLSKAKRFIQLIGEHKSESGSSSSALQGSRNNSVPYSLTKDRLDKFLQERDSTAQQIYEILLLGEIGASRQGVSVPKEAAAVTSIVASLLSILTRGSSTARSGE
ncbi:hypothetical protein [Candidatus Mycoplasma haematominutum]|uniref:Uncharacterized protein n=1 Tax=Candidatus Mycoplasma haematominutum 'Birmingham 1' TaxID=1116213 RepID=G8C3S2_9MOLU|nr:hypothetical protein [Candidatus Mycoplasma haematominutum]CCE66970.1 hypothetical protein MHM_04520 [Candidatus Mycoplasma haematominutum 'Birmingham 1']